MSDYLLDVKDLQVTFFTPAGEVKAVNGISYHIKENEVMGIVGESGSGKSVEAYSIMGLLANPGRIVGGQVTFDGEDLLAYTENQRREFRGNKASMIFQNPMTCLNPVYTIGNQLMEALLCHVLKSISQSVQSVRFCLEFCFLSIDLVLKVFRFLQQGLQVGAGGVHGLGP